MRAEPSPVDFSSSGQSDPHKLEVYPISSSPPDAAQPAIVPASEEEAEVLHASIKAGSVAQIVVAVIAVVGLIYLLKLVMVTTLTALLLAFILEPLVSGLSRLRLPRPAGAPIAVLLTLALAGGAHSFFSPRAGGIAPALPNKFRKIRRTFSHGRKRTTKKQDNTQAVIPAR